MNAATVRTPLLDELRARTREAHRSLEEVVNLQSLASSRQDYAAKLARFLGIWEPIEARLGRSVAAGDPDLDLPARRRAHRLVADLAELGWTPDEIAGLPRCGAEVFSPADVAETAGVLYVLEGSTLGGRVISRELELRLGLGPESGAGFFSGHGEDTVARWRDFLRWAEARTAEDGDIGKAAAAAERTFSLMVAWFEEG